MRNLRNVQVSNERILLLLPGLIGKVTLQIPFYRPHVDPWVISISGLHVIGAPEKIQDFNEEKEKLLERERKKALLQALEERWKASIEPLCFRGSCDIPNSEALADTGSFPCRVSGGSRRENHIGTQSLHRWSRGSWRISR